MVTRWSALTVVAAYGMRWILKVTLKL